MINFFRFALLEEYDGRVAAPAVVLDLAHERPALLADEHTAVVDMPGMEIDLLTAIRAFNVHLPPPSHHTKGNMRNHPGRNPSQSMYTHRIHTSCN